MEFIKPAKIVLPLQPLQMDSLRKCRPLSRQPLLESFYIGYVVEEGNRFAGDVSRIPTMLNWFIVIMGLIPAILGVISVLIYRKYPITNQIRQEMKTFFERNGK